MSDPPAASETTLPELQPLTGLIACSKAGALYGMHAYWSKKPHDAIRAFIGHYTRPGEVVLDPFCGSGGTALAALQEGRQALAFDRSPAATFIARHYCTPAEAARVSEGLATVLKVARRADTATSADEPPFHDPLYSTVCDRCGGKAELRTTLYDHGDPRGIAVPVELSYTCPTCGKGHRATTGRDQDDLEAIARSPLPPGIPADRMMHREGPWGDTWRSGTSSFATVDGLFTPRNLRALGALRAAIEQIEDAHSRDVLRFAFSGQLFCATTMQQVREGGGGFAKGTYYVPRRFLERNVFDGFERRVRSVLAGKAAIPPEGPAPRIALADARSLPLADASVDYVFTDPPYGGAVQYAELNFLWEAWLDLPTDWHAAEIVVNRTRGLSADHWEAGLREALAEMRRVLKPGGWLSLCFAATDQALWRRLGRLLAQTSFTYGGTAALVPAQQSYNRLKPTKKARRDLVVSCRKPLLETVPAPFALETLLADVERLAS